MDDSNCLSEIATSAAGLGPPLRDVEPGPLGRYRGYAELVSSWSELVSRGARARIIGKSARGRALVALEVGPEGARNVSMALAGLHAMEWIGVEVMDRLLHRLVDRPPTDRRVIAYPLVNVDGYVAAEEDLRRGRHTYRRANARAIDLNRNWPVHFRRLGVGWIVPALGRPGREALSEPEVASIVADLDAVVGAGKHLTHALSLHSYGQMILYPFGGRWRAPDDRNRLRRIANTVRARIATPYRVRQCSRWVPGAFAHGVELDTLHMRYGAAALLVECSNGGTQATDPSSWLHPLRWYNPPHPAPVVEELALALDPFVRGDDG